MNVIAIQHFRIKEDGTFAKPGDLLSYPDNRAQVLIDGGWVIPVPDTDSEFREIATSASKVYLDDGDEKPKISEAPGKKPKKKDDGDNQ